MTEQEQAKATDADHPAFLTKRIISHDEAREIAQRLINSHFRNEPGARAGIPARPDYDDDLLIIAYIRQQQAAASILPTRPEQASEVSAVSMRRAMCMPYCVSYGTDRQGEHGARQDPVERLAFHPDHSSWLFVPQ